MKKLLTSVIATTVVLSLYDIWIKSKCVSCGSDIFGLSKYHLAILALIGSSIIAFSYYFSQRVWGFQYVSLGVSGISATVASYLMIVQMKRIICWPCLISDVLFYVIFVLICLDFVYKIKEKITLGGVKDENK